MATNNSLSADLVNKAFLETPSTKMILSFFESIKIGTFVGIPHLRWVGPDRFEFFQNDNNPFKFQRNSGETITPQQMFTDGGSIPRIVQSMPDLSPWEYGAAYIIHDWEFEAHHLGLSTKSFEDVNRTLAEGIKTLMEAGIVQKSYIALYTIWLAVSSPVAKAVWDN
jgi:hypothetical protein